jgi:N-acetylglutamate synthase-like GNAT family acetyltransferase
MEVSRHPPSATELAAMYINAGWMKNPDLEKMDSTVASASDWFVVRNENKDLLGLGRLITDRVRYAFIVDVIVQDSYHGQGIGTKIMIEILAACREYGIDSINLWPSKGKEAFYKRFGFYSLPPDQPHMQLRNIK